MVLSLDKLKISNFKTYQDATFSFSPGHNVIIGENGAGKSSVFEAITYALFGCVSGKTIASLIRHDTKKMEVILEFSINGKDFHVERTATKSTGTALLREKNGRRIAEKAKVVTEEIEKNLGIGPRIFSNVVYIPQGSISKIASERPSERKELFDRILGYSLYKRTSDRLRVVERSTEQNISTIKERIRDFKDDIQRKEQLETELEELENQMIVLTKQLVEIQPKLKKNTEKFNEMNTEKKIINQIEERVRTQKKEILNREKNLSSTIESLEKDLGNSIPVKSNQELLELKIEKQEQLKHLEIAIENTDLKVEKGKEVKNTINELTNRIESQKNQISKIETKINSVLRKFSVNNEAIHEKKQPDWEKSFLTILEKDFTKDRSIFKQNLRIKRHRFTEIQSSLLKLRDQRSSEKRIIESLKKDKEKICPLCGQQVDQSHMVKIRKDKEKLISKMNRDEKQLKKEKIDIELELAESEEEERRIENKEKNQILLKSLYDQIDEIQNQSKETQQEILSNQDDFSFLELEDNIEVLTEQKHDQKILLSNIPRLESIINNREALEKTREENNETLVELNALKGDFDQKSFSKLKNMVQTLTKKTIQKQTLIKTIEQQQIPEKKKQLKEIEKKEKKLKSVVNDLKITNIKLDAINMVREFTKEIVPLLRRQHVMAISEYSSEIFSYLMNNEDYEGIEITNDYELIILQSGKKYDLTILSGGEQVIACLAIRLAIAKLLANQDIMLLDEPTVMLDAFRKKELVEVFGKTKPVRQTIIVTHDTEFERVADSTITIIKRAGVARVIAEEIDHVISQHKKYQALTKERFQQLEI